MHETVEYDETATRRAMLGMVGGSVGALGLGPVAAKKKGKKKKPTPAPLALAMVTVTGLALESLTTFRCTTELVYDHPSSGNIGTGGLNVDQGAVGRSAVL